MTEINRTPNLPECLVFKYDYIRHRIVIVWCGKGKVTQLCSDVNNGIAIEYNLAYRCQSSGSDLCSCCVDKSSLPFSSAGIGGGGIVSSVWVITAELVEVRHRAKWSQALSLTWSCSAIAGPLIGGVFSGKWTLNIL